MEAGLLLLQRLDAVEPETASTSAVEKSGKEESSNNLCSNNSTERPGSSLHPKLPAPGVQLTEPLRVSCKGP